MTIKSNTIEFIEKSIKYYGIKYNYTKVNYIKANIKVEIICDDHGSFFVTPNKHLGGQECQYCSRRKILMNKDIFMNGLNDFQKTHYKYVLIEEIKKETDKVPIICDDHGIFYQMVKKHLLGQMCPKCAWECRIEKMKLRQKKFTTEQIIELSKQAHGDTYGYTNTIYVNFRTKMCITCKEHGDFWQYPGTHIYYKCGCPKCNTSKGELIIEEYLKNNNINYITQYRFIDCRNIIQLPFDFYLPDFNLCIEYDGKQHFEPVRFGGISMEEAIENFIYTKNNDKIKNKYCENKNINLIRIPYWEKDINKILLENIK